MIHTLLLPVFCVNTYLGIIAYFIVWMYHNLLNNFPIVGYLNCFYFSLLKISISAIVHPSMYLFCVHGGISTTWVPGGRYTAQRGKCKQNGYILPNFLWLPHLIPFKFFKNYIEGGSGVLAIPDLHYYY